MSEQCATFLHPRITRNKVEEERKNDRLHCRIGVCVFNEILWTMVTLTDFLQYVHDIYVIGHWIQGLH